MFWQLIGSAPIGAADTSRRTGVGWQLCVAGAGDDVAGADDDVAVCRSEQLADAKMFAGPLAHIISPPPHCSLISSSCPNAIFARLSICYLDGALMFHITQP